MPLPVPAGGEEVPRGKQPQAPGICSSQGKGSLVRPPGPPLGLCGPVDDDEKMEVEISWHTAFTVIYTMLTYLLSLNS